MKRKYYLALLAILLIFSNLSFAKDTELLYFEVSVSLPSRSFYIVPSDPSWIHNAQILPWNPATSSLGSLRKHFDVLHSANGIEARLETPAYISDGKSNIDLKVTLNRVDLSHVNAKEVVPASDATKGSRVLLEITPQEPTGGYKPGDYAGNVLLIFDAKIPGA
ncbi:CS1 type fimbrial major subunit [Pseudomonas sp. CCNWLW23]|uniref:CS1 type fimbrial major subunit n=1 Tax=Pseudomonas sp. CCNWLW23 TaxID=3126385 RepID=UPI00301318B7